ncbi:MAG: hypothetical protein M1562_01320 [Candidatus Marsarchaeota archaeon]|jgi:hypothetical protein|nr:hypothetical protein [Candidatus Marsarchaeota archaeon]
MAESSEEVEQPDISEIAIPGKLLGSLEEIETRLKSLSMFEAKLDGQSLSLINVESRDIKKNPYLFFIITFKPDSIFVQYSIARDSSEKLRRLYIIKNLTGIISLIADKYTVDSQSFYQQIDSAIDAVLNSISQSYSTLFGNYDSLLNEYREVKKLNIELINSNKILTAQASKLKDENDALTAKLKDLERYSDQSLMVMVQDWIESHANTIDIGEFSKNYNLPQPRVEQILNKMVSLKYIELKG